MAKVVFSKQEETAIRACLIKKKVQDIETSHRPITNIYLVSEATASSLNSAAFQAVLTSHLCPKKVVAILCASLTVYFLDRNPRYKQEA